MKRERIELLKQNLLANLRKLEKAKNQLAKSYNSINFNFDSAEFSDAELEKFESLSARFARTADILTQKVLKNFLIIIQEDFKTFLDICDISEKYNLTDSAEDLLNIRDLRNQIAHEYEEDEINKVFREVSVYTPKLLQAIEKSSVKIQSELDRI